MNYKCKVPSTVLVTQEVMICYFVTVSVIVLLLHSGLEPGNLGLNFQLYFLPLVSLWAKDWPPESQ